MFSYCCLLKAALQPSLQFLVPRVMPFNKLRLVPPVTLISTKPIYPSQAHAMCTGYTEKNYKAKEATRLPASTFFSLPFATLDAHALKFHNNNGNAKVFFFHFFLFLPKNKAQKFSAILLLLFLLAIMCSKNDNEARSQKDFWRKSTKKKGKNRKLPKIKVWSFFLHACKSIS